MAFSPVETVKSAEAELLVAPCTSPARPDAIIGTINAPFRACAAYFGGYPAGIDGYEWTISGGYITSGQGSNCIDYVRVGNSTTLCVRAYTIGSFGAKCYSGTKCTTFSGGGGCIICP
ncbi:MAG TPA: hypothetical protein DCR93_26215 [Cytophagales bacterium]|nr:hypothetical protein [Cytophagales bacterium]HAP62842.1 hypothetical protein [Cytophagales bacterium]